MTDLRQIDFCYLNYRLLYSCIACTSYCFISSLISYTAWRKLLQISMEMGALTLCACHFIICILILCSYDDLVVGAPIYAANVRLEEYLFSTITKLNALFIHAFDAFEGQGLVCNYCDPIQVDLVQHKLSTHNQIIITAIKTIL